MTYRDDLALAMMCLPEAVLNIRFPSPVTAKHVDSIAYASATDRITGCRPAQKPIQRHPTRSIIMLETLHYQTTKLPNYQTTHSSLSPQIQLLGLPNGLPLPISGNLPTPLPSPNFPLTGLPESNLSKLFIYVLCLNAAALVFKKSSVSLIYFFLSPSAPVGETGSLLFLRSFNVNLLRRRQQKKMRKVIRARAERPPRMPPAMGPAPGTVCGLEVSTLTEVGVGVVVIVVL